MELLSRCLTSRHRCLGNISDAYQIQSAFPSFGRRPNLIAQPNLTQRVLRGTFFQICDARQQTEISSTKYFQFPLSSPLDVAMDGGYGVFFETARAPKSIIALLSLGRRLEEDYSPGQL